MLNKLFIKLAQPFMYHESEHSAWRRHGYKSQSCPFPDEWMAGELKIYAGCPISREESYISALLFQIRQRVAKDGLLQHPEFAPLVRVLKREPNFIPLHAIMEAFPKENPWADLGNAPRVQ